MNFKVLPMDILTTDQRSARKCKLERHLANVNSAVRFLKNANVNFVCRKNVLIRREGEQIVIQYPVSSRASKGLKQK